MPPANLGSGGVGIVPRKKYVVPAVVPRERCKILCDNKDRGPHFSEPLIDLQLGTLDEIHGDNPDYLTRQWCHRLCRSPNILHNNLNISVHFLHVESLNVLSPCFRHYLFRYDRHRLLWSRLRSLYPIFVDFSRSFPSQVSSNGGSCQNAKICINKQIFVLNVRKIEILSWQPTMRLCNTTNISPFDDLPHQRICLAAVFAPFLIVGSCCFQPTLLESRDGSFRNRKPEVLLRCWPFQGQIAIYYPNLSRCSWWEMTSCYFCFTLSTVRVRKKDQKVSTSTGHIHKSCTQQNSVNLPVIERMSNLWEASSHRVV